jgi:hypothetical protein
VGTNTSSPLLSKLASMTAPERHHKCIAHQDPTPPQVACKLLVEASSK